MYIAITISHPDSKGVCKLLGEDFLQTLKSHFTIKNALPKLNFKLGVDSCRYSIHLFGIFCLNSCLRRLVINLNKMYETTTFCF